MGMILKKANHKNTARVKVIIYSLIFVILFNISTPALAEESEKDKTTMVFIIDNNSYTADGELIVMDVSPMIVEGRTMLPIRYAASPLGADIKWNGEDKKVTLILGDKILELWVGQSNALVNGLTIPIDADNPNVKPLIVNERTMLPLRFVTENLGCELLWDPETKKITITKDRKSDDSTIPPIGIVLPPIVPTFPSLIIDAPIRDLSKNQINELILSKDLSNLNDIWSVNQPDIAKKVTLSESDFPVVLRIGRGYDVFGKYASVESLKQSVLDLEKLITDQKIERIRYDQGVNTQITSDSIRSYSRTLSKNISGSGSYFGFGGSAKLNFNSTRTSQLNNYFSTSSYIVKKFGVYVNGSTNLKNYLNSDAKKMINDNNVTAKTVFGNYGHYVLVDTITGGRVDYSITAKSDSSTSYDNFVAATKADFNVLVFKASANAEYQNIKNKSEYDSNKEQTLNTYGGNFSLNLGQFLNDPQILSKWESTLEENGTLVDFGTTTEKSLVPIWELADTSSRSTYLKSEFEKLNLAQGNQWPMEKYITDIVFVTGSDAWSARAKTPPGYMLIDVDLNTDAGGDFIFLCYKLGDNINDAYTDFFMEYNNKSRTAGSGILSHNSNNVNYTRIGTDLNKGAGGDFLYLFTTKAQTLPPVKGVNVSFDSSNAASPDWNNVYWLNSKNPADVNKGAGGKYVYIKFKR
ncbi:MAG: stalk domain-containing protein [Gudongella sp.]|nr:stalk domain-containing protein [Gudongella sp.]